MLVLALHPSETRRPRHKVRASARRIVGSDLITLRFEVEGAGFVAWPGETSDVTAGATEAPTRRDGLWKETCFECFVGASTDAYCEWNFAPSGDGAAYHFDSYREGMRNPVVAAPTVERTSVGDRARYEISFAVAEEFIAGATWTSFPLSLTAVIVEKAIDGTASPAPFYWALAHAGPKPDFHLRESFTLELES